MTHTSERNMTTNPSDDCVEVFLSFTSPTSVLATWHDGLSSRSVGEVVREGETLADCTARVRSVVLGYTGACVFREPSCQDCTRRARYLVLVPWYNHNDGSTGAEWEPLCAPHTPTDGSFEIRRIEELTR